MNSFFAENTQTKTVTHGVATFDLPVNYYRDDLSLLFYTADLEKVMEIMPSDNLHPVCLPGGKSLVGIAAFNYIETAIGPYGEVGVVVPVVHGPKKPPSILPLLLESRYPGFGTLVMHLPVTNQIARDAGRGQWGYTKFVADMDFTVTPELIECRLQEGDRHILTTRVERTGIILKDRKPLVTYSVLDGNLIKTTIPQKGIFRFAIGSGGSSLDLGNHPVADSIRELKLGAKPLLSRYYLERWAILPEGEIIEKGVKPLDGYRGEKTEGRHAVSYIESC